MNRWTPIVYIVFLYQFYYSLICSHQNKLTYLWNTRRVRVRNGGGETIFFGAGCGFQVATGSRLSGWGRRQPSGIAPCQVKPVQSWCLQRGDPVERSPLTTLTADDNWRLYPGLQTKLVVTLTSTSTNQPDWLTGYRRQPQERSSPEEVAGMRCGDYRGRRWLLELATQCLLYWWLILVSLGELFQNVHDVSDNSNS